MDRYTEEKIKKAADLISRTDFHYLNVTMSTGRTLAEDLIRQAFEEEMPNK